MLENNDEEQLGKQSDRHEWEEQWLVAYDGEWEEQQFEDYHWILLKLGFIFRHTRILWNPDLCIFDRDEEIVKETTKDTKQKSTTKEFIEVLIGVFCWSQNIH